MTRSRIRSRSNSASAARMWSWSLPAGVVQSMPSPKLTNATPTCLQVFEHRHEVPQVASEPVQTPAHQHVESSALGILQEGIESRTLVLRAADATVNVFGGRPAACLAVAPKLLELILAGLVAGRYSRVDGRTSRCSHVVSRFAPYEGKSNRRPNASRSKHRRFKARRNHITTSGRQSSSKLHIGLYSNYQTDRHDAWPRCGHNASSERVCDLSSKCEGSCRGAITAEGPDARPGGAHRGRTRRLFCGQNEITSAASSFVLSSLHVIQCPHRLF